MDCGCASHQTSNANSMMIRSNTCFQEESLLTGEFITMNGKCLIIKESRHHKRKFPGSSSKANIHLEELFYNDDSESFRVC